MNLKSAILFHIFIYTTSFALGLLMLAVPYHFTSTNEFSTYQIAYAIITLSSLAIGCVMGTLLDMYNRKNILLYYFFFIGISMTIASFFEPNNYLIILLFSLSFYGYILFFPGIYSIIRDSFFPKKYLLTITIVNLVEGAIFLAASYLGVLLLEGTDEPIILSLIDNKYFYELYIEALSIDKIILLTGIVQVVALIPLFFCNYKKRNNNNNEKNFFLEMKKGFNYLIINKRLFYTLLLSYFIFISLMLEGLGLLSKYVNNALELGSETFSQAKDFYSLGASTSSIIIILAAIFSFFYYIDFSKLKTTSFIFLNATFLLLISLLFILCSITPTLTTLLIASFSFGLLNAFSKIFRVLYMFRQVPNNYMARTNSIMNLATTVVRLIFIMIFSIPIFSKSSNITYAYAILGLFTLLGGITLFMMARTKTETFTSK